MHDIERPWMALPTHDCTNTPQVTTSSNHAQIARLEFDKVQNFGSRDFQLDGVVDLDHGVGVADGATIAGNQEGNSLRASLHSLNFAQLVLKHKKFYKI